MPNITGIAAFGPELVSDGEVINVIPPPTARFQIVTETIRARQETFPEFPGSDEVGCIRWLFRYFSMERSQRTEQKFKDIQAVDFDSGTQRDITRIVFKHDQPILGMVMSVRGNEIDGQRAYDQEITSRLDFFIDLVKEQARFIRAALLALGGISALTRLGLTGAIIAGIAALITLGIDIIVAL